MKVLAVNGSPRKKKWNTVTLLENVCKGAESAGADVELIHLYDLKFSGCISCFTCKKIDRKEDGVCAVQDDLSPVLERVKECDALVIGTPVYYGTESSATRAFLERLFFPYLKYAKDMSILFPRRIKTGLIYTMNVPESWIESIGYDKRFEATKNQMERYFGPCDLLLATDTMQYSDYDKYESEMFDKHAKIKRHKEKFPEDCEKAYDMGVRLGSSEQGV
jgi:multimeric flavodoxin WrbA